MRCAITVRHHGAGRRQIDKTAHAFALDHAAPAGGDVDHHVRRRQARHHGFGGVGDFRWRARRDGAKRGEIADRLLARVIDDDLVSGLKKPARHMRTHIAETDKADVHYRAPPFVPSALRGREGRGREG
jgi:hypothetical protein